VVIDPRTKQIVWQYGHLGVASFADGYLSKPDGLQLLPARGLAGPTPRTPTASTRPTVAVRRLPDLTAPVQDAALAPVGSGTALLLGGLDAADSSRTDVISLDLRGRPSARSSLPTPVHDAAAVTLGGSVYLFGGGQAASTDAILRLDPTTGASASAGRLPEPRSDLGAASVGDTAYLVGGFTGARPLDTILAWRLGASARVVGRLPEALRYAAVAALGGQVVIAGGSTPTGASDAVLLFDPATGRVTRIGRLPAPTTHAAAAAAGGRVYVIGGRGPAPETPTDRVVAVEIRGGRVRVTRVASLPEPLSDAAATAVGDRILVAGGRHGGAPRGSLLLLTPP
jgi:N-acetylneuraminic acid mutarotase